MSDVKEEEMEQQRGTPVTVLTGALGAGKTTLLKYILEKDHGYRVAVIQNEFSEEMGIEKPLITDAGGEEFKDIIELPNGCLCCSAKDGLISALDNLLEQKAKFDYVLVEATGVADPESICEIFWLDDELGSKVFLDGVVTLVDYRNALSALGRGAESAAVSQSAAAADSGDAAVLGLEKESLKQVACADVLIMNKVDLLPDASARAHVEQRVRAINPIATLLESTRSVVPLASILGIRAFDRSRLATSLAALGNHGEHGHGEAADGHSCSDTCAEHGHGEVEMGHGHGGYEAHGHGHGHGDGAGHIVAPDHGIESLLLRGASSSAMYDSGKINRWLSDVLWEGTAGGVYRCKGIFQGPPEDEDAAVETQVYTLQGVGKIFEVEEAPHGIKIDQSKILLIGRKMDRRALEEGWRQCLLTG